MYSVYPFLLGFYFILYFSLFSAVDMRMKKFALHSICFTVFSLFISSLFICFILSSLEILENMIDKHYCYFCFKYKHQC